MRQSGEGSWFIIGLSWLIMVMTIILMVMMVMVVMMVMMVAMAMTRTWLPFISNLKTRGPTVTVKWRLGGRSHLKHGQPVATIAQSKN